MDIKERMIKSLKEDCDVLIRKKIPRALENISDEKGVNTYRNLTRALADNIKLIEEFEKDDYKPMWSIYETGANDGNLTPQVAVWKQNGKGNITNHQVFDINYKIKADTINGVCITGNIKDDVFSKILKDKLPKMIEDVLAKKTTISESDEFTISLISDKKIINTGDVLRINDGDYTVINVVNKPNNYEYSLLQTDEWNKHLKAE